MALKAETGCKINCLNTPSDEILKDTGIFPLQFGFVWVQKGDQMGAEDLRQLQMFPRGY